MALRINREQSFVEGFKALKPWICDFVWEYGLWLWMVTSFVTTRGLRIREEIEATVAAFLENAKEDMRKCPLSAYCNVHQTDGGLMLLLWKDYSSCDYSFLESVFQDVGSHWNQASIPSCTTSFLIDSRLHGSSSALRGRSTRRKPLYNFPRSWRRISSKRSLIVVQSPCGRNKPHHDQAPSVAFYWRMRCRLPCSTRDYLSSRLLVNV